MKALLQPRRRGAPWSRAAALLLAAGLHLPATAQVDLADRPLFSTIGVPGNLVLALSVEWPTASTPAYLSTTPYSAAATYLGYFDPYKCYRYVYDSAIASNSYFTPASTTADRTCTTSSSATPRWSGNYLNWASTQTLDTFRWALTGGDRVVDTTSETIVEKTRHSGQGTRSTVYPDKVLASAVNGATPFTWGAAVTRVHGLGTALYISGGQEFSCTFNTNNSSGSRVTTSTCNLGNSGAGNLTVTSPGATPSSGGNWSGSTTHPSLPVTLSCSVSRDGSNVYTYSCRAGDAASAACTQSATYSTITGTTPTTSCSTTPTPVDYNAQSSLGGAAASSAYRLYVRVKVCDPTVGVEANCKQYGANNYKPEGLMQQYAMKLRYSAFGYLNHSVPDGTPQRDGGVMRARMKSIGPQVPVPGAPSTSNPLSEWSAADGTMLKNPDPLDALATTTAASSEGGYSVTVDNSGVMNYLNRFGKLQTGNYKSNDPAGELYYSAQRYLRNLGPVGEYASLAGSGSPSELAKWIDGFPVIKSWTPDPIQHSCQKNFILGIGDVYTHRDQNLPGSAMPADSREPAVPAAVTADGSVNVKTATDMVGQLEGLSSLGSARTGSGTGTAATYFITGLAYDAHTRDIRPDEPSLSHTAGKQTISTYWLDVMENQTYVSRNQYWLAAKYGGFEVPDLFDPYAAGNGTSTLKTPMWSTNNDTLGVSDRRPDNYFVADNGAAMVKGLSEAFARIDLENNASTGSAFSTATAKISSLGGATYSTEYVPRSWSGDLVGSQVSFDTSGNPTLAQQWSARDQLDATAPNARKIVTCCTSAGAALPFQDANLSSAMLHPRTYYASFASVPGAASQSAANYVAWLRGDRTKERGNGGAYRSRLHLLGDIVGSKATPVGAPSAPYLDLTNPGYGAFKRTHANRKTVAYAGANDGMMHAFDGTMPGATACASCGTELFAYIPSFVYGSASTAAADGLAALGNPSYTHRYYIDATPLHFDLDFNKTAGASGGPNWRTILIGGLGKGGKGYYAIDITDPASWTSESAVAGKVLWEFTDSRMGYSFGEPSVVKTKKYGWVAVLTSGYNNADGKGYLFIVNPRTGALLETIATPEGSTSAPIDLGQHTVYIPDYADFMAETVYAGDLRGNVWRFDLTPESGSYAAATKIAVLADGSGNGQPVTTRPLTEIDPASKKRYIVVGTGRLLADSDIASTQQQTLYAIIDGTAGYGAFFTSATLPGGVSFPVLRGNLNANTALLAGIGASPPNPMGWYIDLGAASGNGIGERINVNGTARGGVIAMPVNLPNGQACDPSGTGRVIAVTLGEGKTVLVNGTVNVESYASTSVIRDLAILNVRGSLRLVAGTAKGDVARVGWALPASLALRRLNWREVPTTN